MKLCPACRGAIASAEWRCARCNWRAEIQRGVTVLLPSSQAVAGGFSADQFHNLLEVMSRHFWFAARTKLIVWALRRFFPGARAFLEVGCGTGHVARSVHDALPGLQVTASEGSLEGLTLLAAAASDLTVVQADVTALPYDGEFDVIGAFDVLEHVPDDLGALREIARSLSDGGGLVLTVPQHPSLWSPLDDYSGHQRRYTRTGMLDTLRAAGFDVIHATSFVSLLLPVLLLSRMTQRGAPVDPMQEFRISPLINRVAGAIMAVERRLITAGVALPAGGSLLVVARRQAPTATASRSTTSSTS